MLNIYNLYFNNERKRIFPINDLYHDSLQYTSIYKLHYKPFFFETKNNKYYKKQLELCNRLSNNNNNNNNNNSKYHKS